MSSNDVEQGQFLFSRAFVAHDQVLEAIGSLPRQTAFEVIGHVYKRLKREIADRSESTPPVPPPKKRTAARELSKSPTSAIREFLRDKPDGATAGEIVAALAGRIETTYKDPKKLLYSMLAGLKRTGKVQKSDDGRFCLVDQS